MTLLNVEELGKRFGGIQALEDVSVSIDEGELVGVIGPNGAGKSTFFNCVSGVITPDSGTVRFNSEDVTEAEPETLARDGLVRTFQHTRELQTMTVRENVRLAAPNHPGERTLPALLRTKSMTNREASVREQADDLIESFELSHLVDEYSSSLSGGQRKLLELARTLMLDPTLLMLDEPFAGVNPTLTNEIADHIKQLNDGGMTIVVIEHELETLAELVDRLIVLQQGKLLVDGEPDEVLSDERVIEAYLGGGE
ncbi:amino acid/amide ABC transporter ATP-binding protein 1 (HAAT family) [Haloarcula quadrata]|uniref:Probable branched-chain amino acid transport ATP-binding protein LivG n=1 Tax=Haloarcula quadrata TaxID=182779 RepID=A0A495QQC7_9EURY|nr:ABC transporter ATP-binding protein [Haloarcula quadrata]RKS75175.1 amino acid/amide ABC transporter ATP-binding protein 1 (HAAT family) [Haloarcula quadrata]